MVVPEDHRCMEYIISSPRGPSMYGIHYILIASSVNMFKNRTDKYLVKAGYN